MIGFEVLTTVTTASMGFWAVRLCSPRFRRSISPPQSTPSKQEGEVVVRLHGDTSHYTVLLKISLILGR
jgi:hypothetical protein